MAHFIEVNEIEKGKRLVNVDHVILVRTVRNYKEAGCVLELDSISIDDNSYAVYVKETMEEVKNKIINAKKKRIWHF